MSRNRGNISGLHPSVLRRMNAIEIFHTLRLSPGASQREIGHVTSIDRSTVSTIISYFDELGLLDRQTDEASGRRGRPSESLSLRPEAGLLIGIHITPENIAFVASGLDGAPTAHSVKPLLPRATEIGDLVEAGLQSFLSQIDRRIGDVRAIGVAVPGLIDSRGLLAESSNLRWHDLNLQDILTKRLGPHVRLGNDSRAAGIAEKLFGRCAEVDDYIYLDSASGVGGVLFLGGAVYMGAGGFAGELGHAKVIPNGRLCTCGGIGCLSAYISEPALVRRFGQLGLEARDFAEMRALAESGSASALPILDEAGEMLGIALANFINLFNPPHIVLGGGLAVLSPFLMPAAERMVARHALASSRKLCAISTSQLALERVPRGGLALALSGLTELTGDTAFPW